MNIFKTRFMIIFIILLLLINFINNDFVLSLNYENFNNNTLDQTPISFDVHYVGQNSSFKTIQAAVDFAQRGDTIFVENGTYHESVTIDKANLSLIGNSSTDCRIKHHYSGTNFDDFAAGINVTADNVSISGFNISVIGNWTYGVFLNSMNDGAIFNTTISTYGKISCPGIYLMYSNYCYIKDNKIQINNSEGIGITFYVSTYNIIHKNLIITDKNNGIFLGSDFNYIIGNTMIGGGIYLLGKFNKIIDNKINSAKYYGFYLYQSKNNTIKNNFITTTGERTDGIYFYKFNNDNNKLINNTIISTGKDANCISIVNSDNTLISNCTIINTAQNGFGVYLDSKTAIIKNTKIKATGTGGYDIWIENYGKITVINSSFDTVQLTRYYGGSIYVKNYLDIKVFDDDGTTPLPAVDVEIKDNDNIIYATPGYGGTNETTNAHGQIGHILIMDRWYKRSNNPVENITSVCIKKNFDQFWEVNRTNVNMNTSHTEVFYHDITPPSTPTGLRIERINRTNDLNISWNQNIDTITYELQTNKSGQWKILSNTIHPYNWTFDKNLQYDIWYYYQLRAWDKVGLYSELSIPVGFYLEENKPPSTPNGLVAKPISNDDALNISWDLNTDFTTTYELYWKAPGFETWEHLNNISDPINYYIFKTKILNNGTTYEFKIRARDSLDLFSAFSMPVSVIHRDFIPPAPPANLIAETISQSVIRLNWNQSISLDIEGYQIYINSSKIDANDSYMALDKVNKLSSNYEITDLKDNTVYYFTISAFDEANNPSIFSNIAWNTTFAYPEPPVLPKINKTIPVHNSTDVPVNCSVVVEFNIPMNIESVEKVLDITPYINYDINWTENDTILHINFIKNLSYNISYKITIGIAKSKTSYILEAWPFVLKFTTKQKVIPKPQVKISIKIISPVNDTQINPGEQIVIFGTSTGFVVGTAIYVIVNDHNTTTTIGPDGNWTITLNLPGNEGNYSIIVKAGNRSASVRITVKDSNKPGVNNKDGNETGDGNTGIIGMGLMMDLVLIFIITIIFIIILFIIFKKKRASEKNNNAEMIENNFEYDEKYELEE